MTTRPKKTKSTTKSDGTSDASEVFGPFSGTFDPSDPGASRTDRLFDSVNLTIEDPEDGSPAAARHGMAGLVARATYDAGGGLILAQGQAISYFQSSNGAAFVFVFAGGRMYQWDGDDATYPGTDITPTTVLVDPTNRIYCAQYNDQIAVSDEQNPPWVYNPVSASATVIDIDGNGTQWNTKGGPIIYAGKLFFILKTKGGAYINSDGASPARIASDGDSVSGGRDLVSELTAGFQNTLVWCEELTPTIGYIQTNFADFWTLTQTGSEFLGGLAGDEGLLIYFRTQGTGTITGAVNTNFQSTATRDALSSTVGTQAPASLCFVDRTLYFVDIDGRPYRIVAGSSPEPLWLPLRRTIESQIGTTQNRANVVLNAQTVYHQAYGVVLMTIWDRQTIYAFQGDTGQYIGQWVIGGMPGASVSIDCMGTYVDSNGRTVFALLGSRTDVVSSATQGVLWRQKFPTDANQWLDEATQGGSTTALYRAAETHWMTRSAGQILQAIAAAAQLGGDSAGHAVGMQYLTPSGGESSLITATSTPVTGEKATTDAISAARWGFGPNAQGTSLRFRFVVTHTDNVRWMLHNVEIDARATRARPRAA